jgi:glycosyltransferase involved in cell wall biosynthesis
MQRLLFLSWRDKKNPKNGGAENFTHELMKRLVAKGYGVFHFSCSFEGSEMQETIDGVSYHRGSKNPLKIILDAKKFYHKNRGFDWVIDQRNTHHFFTHLWLPKNQPRALFIHQTTRELWHTEMHWSTAWIGHIHEILTLKQQRYYPAFTASHSTADELIRDFGFHRDRTFPFHQGLNYPCPPIKKLPEKFKKPTFLYVGRFSQYKGIDATIIAFQKFYEKNKTGKLYIVGKKNKKFEQEIWNPLTKKHPELEKTVNITGFVSEKRRDELMARSHAILVPSHREGWGIIVTEAAAQGTTAIVYPSPGLMEAVDFGRTGLITRERSPEELFHTMDEFYRDPKLQKELTKKARAWAETFDWDRAADQADVFFNDEKLLGIFR